MNDITNETTQEIISEEETENLDILEDRIEGESAELTNGELMMVVSIATGLATAGAGAYALATKVVIPKAKKIAAGIKEAAEDRKNLTKEEREEKKLHRKMEKLVIKANKKKLAEIEQQYAEEAEAAQKAFIDILVDKELNKELDDKIEDFDDDLEESSETTEE